MLLWLNGKFVERDAAMISAFDAGLLHGIGLFETLSAHNGRAFRPLAHAQRLVDSAGALLLNDSLRAEALAEAIAQSITRNQVQRARIRMTVTGGNLNVMGAPGHRKTVDPTILIDVGPATEYPDAFFESGVMVTIAQDRLNPLDPMAGHKTLNYWPRIHALQHAAVKKAGESLWFTVANHLAGGSVSNVFLVKDGRLLTPLARGEEDQPTGPAVLPGITRAAMLELADTLDIGAARQTLDVNDLLAADEIFLTNSSWGVLPVAAVEAEQVGNGGVGEVTRSLRAAWLDLVEEETSED